MQSMFSTGSYGTSHPLIGAGLDTSEGRSFVRERLALLGKTVALISLGMLVVFFVMHAALETLPPEAFVHSRRMLARFGGVVTMGLLWLVATRGDSSLRTLGIIDAVSLIVTCVFFALMIESTPGGYRIGVLAATICVIARAIVVPSSPRRTMILSSLAMLPVLAASLVFLAPHFVADDRPPLPRGSAMIVVGVTVLLWSAAAVVVAWVASRVIYGLRQQVKEAAELGAYTLEARIGSGGMGEVWRARHRMLIRPAAVKLIRPEIAAKADHELLMRRFEREARATSALSSPHTVQLFDFGVAADGTLYYVMELLEGFNLEQLVMRFGPQTAERVVYILGQLCSSLAEAHRNGLVHRDIKPANVFLTRPDGAADFVKVVDFGLVKVDSLEPQKDEPKLTVTGMSVGTPAFMAPEVIAGAEKTDHRLDLYSVGCVAFWLLTGRLVFEGNSMTVIADHLRTPPPRPSSRVELPIPRELDELILACLEKQPADRPASAAAVIERLQAIPLTTAWTLERAERWWATYARDVGVRQSAADLLVGKDSGSRGKLHTPQPAGA